MERRQMWNSLCVNRFRRDSSFFDIFRAFATEHLYTFFFNFWVKQQSIAALLRSKGLNRKSCRSDQRLGLRRKRDPFPVPLKDLKGRGSWLKTGSVFPSGVTVTSTIPISKLGPGNHESTQSLGQQLRSKTYSKDWNVFVPSLL